MTPTELMTTDELLAMPSPCDGTRYEFVRGELIEMAPTEEEHGTVATTIAIVVGPYVRKRQLGTHYTAEAGFFVHFDPDTVRAPSYAFLSKERLPVGKPNKKFLALAPDLAFKVVSPSDSAAEINAKIEEYFAAGTRLV